MNLVLIPATILAFLFSASSAQASDAVCPDAKFTIKDGNVTLAGDFHQFGLESRKIFPAGIRIKLDSETSKHFNRLVENGIESVPVRLYSLHERRMPYRSFPLTEVSWHIDVSHLEESVKSKIETKKKEVPELKAKVEKLEAELKEMRDEIKRLNSKLSNKKSGRAPAGWFESDNLDAKRDGMPASSAPSGEQGAESPSVAAPVSK